MADFDKLTEILTSVDNASDAQRHVLHFWPELTEEQRTALAKQIVSLLADASGRSRVSHLCNVLRESVLLSSKPPARIAPPESYDVVNVAALPAAELATLREDGLHLLANGGGAVVVLAGGSGTRLGVAFAKGKLVCPDLVTPKSLFQLQCEKIRAMEIVVDEWVASKGPSSTTGRSSPKCKIQIGFMTSQINEQETREFFEQNHFFGLEPSQVHFFSQGLIPSFTNDGRIILESPHAIAAFPNGNAGFYRAMDDSGLLTRWQKKFNVEFVQVVTVDNLLVKIADPVMFGVGVTSNADVVAKTTPKAHDHEAVGVFARRSYGLHVTDDTPLKWGVIEYTEIGKELAAARRPGSDERLYDCGNIAMHLFSTSFLHRAADEMKTMCYYHVARKPIPSSIAVEVDGGASLYGHPVDSPGPGKINGIKLEAFIFDVFQFADRFKIISVNRADEFSAVKNADIDNREAKDSPKSAVADLHRLHLGWLSEALRQLAANADSGDVCATIAELVLDGLQSHPAEGAEIAPSFALDVAGVVAKLRSNETLLQRLSQDVDSWRRGGKAIVSLS